MGIRAFRLTTGADGHSHVERGTVAYGAVVGATSVEFKETPAGSSLAWHNAPVAQYVVNLAGVLEFAVRSGDAFTLRPGDVLVALDVTGSGHTWRLTNDEPWRRAYVIVGPGADPHFVPDSA